MTDTEATLSIKQTSGWFEWVKKYLPTLAIIGSAVYFVLTFFNTSKADHQDIINMKLELQQLEKDKASVEALKALQDQVNRQYATSKDDKEKENQAIEEVADYMHEQIGYQKAIKDFKK